MRSTPRSTLAAVLAGALLMLLAPAVAPAAESPALAGLMSHYDAARAALASDRLGEVAQPAHELQHAIAALTAEKLDAAAAGVSEEQLGAVRELLPPLRKASQALVAASGLVEARTAFGDLSKQLIAWRKLAGSGPDVGFCPMVGKAWLQAAEAPVENPYGGRAMATCGQVGPPH